MLNNGEYMKTLLQYHCYFSVEEMAYTGLDETEGVTQENGKNSLKLCYPLIQRLRNFITE